MLSVKDIPWLRGGTPTPGIPDLDIGATGTVWVGFEVLPSAQPNKPFPRVFESLSFTINDSSGLSYEILRPIPVVVEEDEDCVIASFNEANIHASGDTKHQAVSNLKTYIGDVFDEFLAVGVEALGSGLRREFAVLQTFIQKRNAE